MLDATGRVVEANHLAEALLDRPCGGEPLDALVRPASVPVTEPGGCARWRVELLGADGVPVLADAACADADWAPGRRLVLLRPLDTGALLRETERFLDAAFELAPIGMAFFNPEGQYVRVNPALCALLGRDAEALLGRRDQEFTHPDDRAADVDAAWRILGGEIDSWQTEKRFLRADGSVVHVIASLSFLRDDAGLALTWLGQFQDMTHQKGLEERLRRQADEDPLTGLPNRRRLEREMENALKLSDRHGTRGALLMIDLDGFKAVNDEHGHAAGDEVLTAVAAALRSRLRSTDVLARVGGDEFAALLPLTPRAEAEAVAEALREAVVAVAPGAWRAPRSAPLGLAASIGVAEFGSDGGPETAAALLAAADDAMYATKRAHASERQGDGPGSPAGPTAYSQE